MNKIDMRDLVPYRTAVFDNSRWQNFQPRPDDVFICTPAKCGTTWTQTIVANLIRPDGDFPMPIMQLSPWIEAVFNPEPDMMLNLENQKLRRVIKSHTPADGIPWFPESKYIFVARDGRDAFMSLCNHMERMKMLDLLNEAAAATGVPKMPAYDGDPHAFFDQWLQEDDNFFNIVATYWKHQKQENMLLVHYNDLKKDLGQETRRIADFLDIALTNQQFEAVIERCTFDYMRDHPEMVGDFDMGFEGGIKGFIFKGTNGRWREVLTEKELKRYQLKAEKLLSPEAMNWLECGRIA